MNGKNGSVTESELRFIATIFKYFPAPDQISTLAVDLLNKLVNENDEREYNKIRAELLDVRKQLLEIAPVDSDYHYALNHACNIVWNFGQSTTSEYARLCLKYLGEHIKTLTEYEPDRRT